MKSDPNHETLRVIAFGEKQLELMGENRNELYHLESSEVFFPPDIFLVLGSHRCYHIIEIHNNMNKSVEQSEKCAMAT